MKPYTPTEVEALHIVGRGGGNEVDVELDMDRLRATAVALDTERAKTAKLETALTGLLAAHRLDPSDPQAFFEVARSTALLASSDAALADDGLPDVAHMNGTSRDMRLAEAVRSACIEAMRVDGTPTGMIRCVMEPVNLAAIIAKL